MRLLGYHIRLAFEGLRRSPGVSLIMLTALALGNGLWSIAVSQYVRFQAYEVHLPATLHQVELLRPRDANTPLVEGAATNAYFAPAALMSRTQVTWAEARRLAESKTPARQSAGVRAEVLVRGPAGPEHQPLTKMARFTNGDFFPMFERRFSEGGPWTAAEDADGSSARVVVLGRATGRALFPNGGAVGRTVWVDGQPFRVAGVLAEYQPLNPPWQLLIIGGQEDALFLPLRELERLRATSEAPTYRSVVAPGREALMASDALLVTHWVDLPTPAHVQAYRADLDRLFGAGRWTLRPLAAWRAEFAMPTSQISFFSFMGLVVLIGGASNLSRWLLTIGLVRAEELGVYRALGAPRASIFARTFAQGMLLAVPAALLGLVVGLPVVWLFNQLVHIVDMPLEVGHISIGVAILGPIIASALGSLHPAWRLAQTKPTLTFSALRS